MNDFVEMLILSYFKEYKGNYTLRELSDQIGVPLSILGEMIDDLIEKEELVIRNDLITLSKYGRIKLANSEMEGYKYDKINFQILEPKWPIDKVYCVHNFSKYKWRGSEK